MADTAPLNQRATKASALPKNPRFSGAPRKMHRTLIARSSHYHRTHGMSSRYEPCGRSRALRAFQWRFARSRGQGSSNGASGVPEVGAADNGTEIISPANKQYKGRKSLAAFQAPLGLPYEGEEGFQEREIILRILYNFVL